MKITDWFKVYKMNETQKATIRRMEGQLIWFRDQLNFFMDKCLNKQEVIDYLSGIVNEHHLNGNTVPTSMLNDIQKIQIVNTTEGGLDMPHFYNKDGKTYVKGDV